MSARLVLTRACLLVVFILAASSGPEGARATLSAREIDSRVLFAPELRWRAVEELPELTAPELQTLADGLRHAYLESSLGPELRDQDGGPDLECSFIGRALSGNLAARGEFRWWKDAPGSNNRVLYTGTSHCSEVSLTLLWTRAAEHWRLAAWAFGEALQLLPKSDAAGLVLLRLPACCAERVDVYRVQAWSDAEPLAQVGVDVQTHAPASVIAPEPVTSRSEGLLRRSPERDDAPNEILTLWADAPVLGNQLDRFKADASGWMSARVEDPSSGDAWCFVSLPRTAEASPTEGVFGVQAGWTECGYLQVDKD
jgi:hypothetical protein